MDGQGRFDLDSGFGCGKTGHGLSTGHGRGRFDGGRFLRLPVPDGVVHLPRAVAGDLSAWLEAVSYHEDCHISQYKGSISH